ncbi:MAG: hypothetical protein IJA61_00455 [Clostridia bacterium]|nr:hypothetical protein [Clostridia bacterium]
MGIKEFLQSCDYQVLKKMYSESKEKQEKFSNGALICLGVAGLGLAGVLASNIMGNYDVLENCAYKIKEFCNPLALGAFVGCYSFARFASDEDRKINNAVETLIDKHEISDNCNVTRNEIKMNLENDTENIME